jgi:tetratricopeptide (TPR) repeat protein
MARGDSQQELQQLLARRDFGPALTMANNLVTKTPRDASAWFALARAAFGLGRLRQADEAIDRTIRLGVTGHDVQLIRAVIDHRLGRSAAAIDRLRGLVAKRAPNATDAVLALAEVLHRANRRDELDALVAAGGDWQQDPRAAIFTARVRLKADRAGTITELEELARSDRPALVRRIAGFDAVRLLDADGEYRRAFDLATHLHATTGAPFDLDGMIADDEQQLALVRRGAPWFEPRAPAVRGVSLVVGMPRSGTTLLEQMLDRHPAIGGIGEFDGVNTLGTAVVGQGAWPRELSMLDPRIAAQLQADYLAGTAVTRRSGATWSFDKSLHTWRWLPAVAAVLPGAVCFRIERDPRDTAISLFLSNFHPQSFGWTRSLEGIRRVIAAERALAPAALRALGIPHEDFRYEDLVDRPREHMERCLARMGLPMDDAVLAPEANTRTVLTLSHEQVRRSINRGSIGRWKNYEFAFGPEWA